MCLSRTDCSEAQVAFLRKLPPDTFTSVDELAWYHTCFNGVSRDRVLDIAFAIPHLLADDEHKETIARIRARIEAEVGPLPLALTSDELRNFLR